MKIFWLITTLIISINATEQTITIDVEGMTCPLCTMTIKKNLKKQNGVIKAKIKLSTNSATVIYDDQKTDIPKLLNAIKEVGYKGRLKNPKKEKK